DVSDAWSHAQATPIPVVFRTSIFDTVQRERAKFERGGECDNLTRAQEAQIPLRFPNQLFTHRRKRESEVGTARYVRRLGWAPKKRQCSVRSTNQQFSYLREP
ncbi:unnamed protein product, partial [Pylaiella littoralis]